MCTTLRVIRRPRMTDPVGRSDAAHQMAMTAKACARASVLLCVFQGFPAHDRFRPLSGYVPRGFGDVDDPPAFFLILRHQAGWTQKARALMDDVTGKLNDVPGLRAFNDAQIVLFERHAGQTALEMLNGFAVLPAGCDGTDHRRSRRNGL